MLSTRPTLMSCLDSFLKLNFKQWVRRLNLTKDSYSTLTGLKYKKETDNLISVSKGFVDDTRLANIRQEVYSNTKASSRLTCFQSFHIVIPCHHHHHRSSSFLTWEIMVSFMTCVCSAASSRDFGYLGCLFPSTTLVVDKFFSNECV